MEGVGALKVADGGAGRRERTEFYAFRIEGSGRVAAEAFLSTQSMKSSVGLGAGTDGGAVRRNLVLLEHKAGCQR